MNSLRYIFNFFLLSIGFGQFFYSPVDLGSAGASFSGNSGTHSLQTNPAILGIKPGKDLVLIPVDTVIVSYKVRLVENENEAEIISIGEKLKENGTDHNYEIKKEGSFFVLDALGFKDSFSAHNFSRNLSETISNYKIIADTTREVYYKKKYIFRIQLFATDNKDSLNSFINKSKPLLKGLKRNVSLRDSIYRLSVGNFEYKQEALIIKDSLINIGISPDAFIVKEEMKSTSSSTPKFSLTFPMSYSFNLGNNLFNADWFNTYSRADMVAQPELKDKFLNSIPSRGINGRVAINTSIFDLTYKNFGLSLFNMSIFSNVTFPKSLFNLVFEGLKFEDPINVSDFNFKTYFVNSSNLSYGFPIEHDVIPFKTYIGFGIRFLTGNFAYVDSFSGEIKTSIDSIMILYDQTIIVPDANLGNGYGLDLGVFSSIDEKISGQVSFIGLGSNLKNSVERKHLIQKVQLSNKNIEDLQSNSAISDSIKDSWTILDSSSYENVTIDLPARINIGLNYILSEKIHLKGSIQHLMQTSFIGSINPRFSFGAELLPKTRTPIWTGFSVGGIDDLSTFGIGFGLHLGAFHFNFGINQSGGIFNKAKGLNFGSETRLLF